MRFISRNPIKYAVKLIEQRTRRPFIKKDKDKATGRVLSESAIIVIPKRAFQTWRDKGLFKERIHFFPLLEDGRGGLVMIPDRSPLLNDELKFKDAMGKFESDLEVLEGPNTNVYIRFVNRVVNSLAAREKIKEMSPTLFSRISKDIPPEEMEHALKLEDFEFNRGFIDMIVAKYGYKKKPPRAPKKRK